MAELETTKHQVQKELTDHSFKFEALWGHLVSKTFFFPDEELRAQAIAEVKKGRQRDIQRLKGQIKSLVEQE